MDGRFVQPDGAAIRRLRQGRFWSQEQLAEKAGLRKRTIERAEAGEHLQRHTLLAIAQALGLSPAEVTRPDPSLTPPGAQASPGPEPTGALQVRTESRLPQLPAPVTNFIGRTHELAEVKQRLLTTRLLTLTGPGGCGKTCLALQAAAELADTCADGVWCVELAPLFDPTLVPHLVASAVGVREEPHRPLPATLADALHSRQLLLVLDNCEHLIAACAALAHTLLLTCPQLQLLATSREVLGVAGELAWRVPPLASPDPQRPLPLERLILYEAVQLFVERARTALLTFTVTDRNATEVAQVCHRLDGIPLAIELAAARVKVLAVEQIAARLDERFRLLTGGGRMALPRQQALQAAMDWSYDLLSEQERLLRRRLSVFARGWTLEAAEAVCAGTGLDAAEVLGRLASSEDKSLVSVDVQTREVRYGLIETIRQYGRERLERSGDAAVVRRQHLEWYMRPAERAEPELTGADQGVWLRQLEAEHDNQRAALEWSQGEAQGSVVGLRLAAAVWRFWLVHGHLREGRRWLQAVLAGSGGALPAVRAKALYGAGALAEDQRDYAAARAFFKESLALRRQLADQRGLASSLSALDHVACCQGDDAAACVLLEESLAMSRDLGDRRGCAECLEELAQVASAQGKPEWAACIYGAAEALREALGAPLLLSARAPYDRAVAAVRAALDAGAFAGRWAEGRAMTLEQAIGYALDRHPPSTG
jgi:predicted ATPase/transcriptional regulator with XRE-family HTH domain